MSKKIKNGRDALPARRSLVPSLLVFLLAGVIPLVGSLLIPLIVPGEWFWRSTPFHSFVETAGGATAIVAALIIMIDSRHKKQPHSAIIAAALVGMGILDFFHAMLHLGNTFIFFHVLAELVGSVTLLTALLPRKVLLVLEPWIVRGVIFGAFAGGIFIPLVYYIIPTMMIDEHFTGIAVLMSIVAGVLFFIAGVLFLIRFARFRRTEDFLIAVLAVLFAMPGFLFGHSELWNAQWWWWHIVRLAAYSLIFYYMAILYKSTHVALEESQKELGSALAVAERRRRQAEITKEALKEKVLDLEEQSIATLNILEDVEDEKRRAQRLAQELEKFRFAIDNASDQIIITDANGIMLYANDATLKITGFPLREIIGKKAGGEELWGGQMTHDFYEKLWKTIKKDKKLFSGRFHNRRRNGEEYYADGSISPILNEGGDVAFFVAIQRDVTQEYAVDRAKTEFVSLASHQLRTPLSAINWYAEMLLAGDAGEINDEQKSYLGEIYDGNQRMVALVNALLNVSRLELGTFVVDPEETDIVALGQDVILELTPLVKEKKIHLTETHSENVPHVQVDPKLFRMIYQNLLSNAVKYTPEGGSVRLDIQLIRAGRRAHNRDFTEDMILIAVSDTGYGIPEVQQDKVFSKLFRADNVRAKDTEGTGLGLYVLKAIMDHTGGDIWFDSAEDKGSTFYVTVPVSGMKQKTGTRSLG